MKIKTILMVCAISIIQISFFSSASNASYLRKVVHTQNIFASFKNLETERLIIRPMRPTDLHDLFVMMNNSEVVNQTIALEPHNDLSETEDLLKAVLHNYAPESSTDWAIFAITLKPENRCIGYCGFYAYASLFKRAEIGYALCQEFWGKGIVPEACQALVEYGFKELGLERIEATVYPENKGSVRVLEKLGMKLEGVLRNHVIREGRCRNRLIYSLLRNEWEKL